MRHLVTITADPRTWRALAAGLLERIPSGTMLHTYRSVAAATERSLPPGAYVLVDAAALAGAGDVTDLFRRQAGALVYTDPAELTGDTVGAMALAGLAYLAELPDGMPWLLEQLIDATAVGR